MHDACPRVARRSAVADERTQAPTRLPLCECSDAVLVLLYLAGWTHRDVSVGNIIVVQRDGSFHGKLSDLEYAKKFTEMKISADPKTVCSPSILSPNLT